MKHKCLSEDDVRRIINERLKEVFAFMVEITEETIKYPDTPEDEKSAFVWFQSIVGVTLEQHLGGEA